MNKDSLDALKATAGFLALVVVGILLLAAGLGVVKNIDMLVALARTVPPKTAAFFGFMAFFLWTTFCAQGVINATSRPAKQTWALMLYAAIWTLLVIHLQSQGFGI